MNEKQPLGLLKVSRRQFRDAAMQGTISERVENFEPHQLKTAAVLEHLQVDHTTNLESVVVALPLISRPAFLPIRSKTACRAEGLP
jgi:hypothetical protein